MWHSPVPNSVSCVARPFSHTPKPTAPLGFGSKGFLGTNHQPQSHAPAAVQVENEAVPVVLLVCRNSTDTAYFQRLRPYPRVLLKRTWTLFRDYTNTCGTPGWVSSTRGTAVRIVPVASDGWSGHAPGLYALDACSRRT